MKKIFFFLAMLASVAINAQRTTPVTVTNTNVDNLTKTVTFDLSWKGRDATHRDEVWVFVDIQLVTGANTSGSWSPATLVPNATTVIARSGNQYSSLTYTVVNGNTRGIWVKGTAANTSSSFAATVKLTLGSATPALFNACVYITDYPPNATSYTSGTYTLKGTQQFIINGATISNDKFAGVINTMTDPTGCPGGVGRDVVHNGGTCAPGLTPVGGYCRDLVADEANSYTGCDFEVKQNPTTSCPSGWRIPDYTEAKLMWTHRVGLKLQSDPYPDIMKISGSSYDGNCNGCTPLCCYMPLRTDISSCYNGYVYRYCAVTTWYVCIR